MGTDSKISWTHHTFNPWRGCTKVSPGCKHCYAETISTRNPATLGVWGTRGSRPIAAESYWKLPERWNREAQAAHERRRVFCASLADVFEGQDTMPEAAWESVRTARSRLFDVIADTPQLDWLLLTKRPENIKPLLIEAGRGFQSLPPHVWIGTSVENQQTANERIPHLLKVPAHIRWLSVEPLLEAIDLGLAVPCGYYCDERVGHVDHGFWTPGRHPGIHWIVVGGESGAGARPFDPHWATTVIDQCRSANIPIFVKQMGSVWAKAFGAADRKGEDPREWLPQLQVREYPR